ncbi:MAG: response regulator transcription factor [Frankia sp.]|nr:response regulator transcription factor [Frankia sp.]
MRVARRRAGGDIDALTVVIVDDHASFRAAAGALLEASGMQVVGEAATGAQAVDVVTALRPDVVLLDIQLPDMDGIEVAQRLSSLEPMPVLVLTSSHDARDYGARLTSAQARGFIPKAELTAVRLVELAGIVR